jgi:hypothetical protein
MAKYIFNPKELEGKGIFPTQGSYYGYPFPPAEKLNTPITPRENWKLYFERKPCCWVPDMNFDANWLMPDFIPDNVAGGPDGGYDSFGVKWIPCSNPELPAFVEPGFIRIKDIAEVTDFPYPDPDVWPWQEGAKPFLALDQDRINIGVVQTGMFERMIDVFGFEDAAAYMLTDADYLHIFLDKLVEYNCKMIKNFHTYFKADIIFFHDDWGAQRAPFFSNAAAEEFFLPRFKIMADLCHSLGMKFVHHCCGRSAPFVPLMAKYGADLWNLQIDANEDILPGMIKEYGDRILFDIYFGYLGIDPLPQNDEDSKSFIEEKYKIFGKQGNCSIGFFDVAERGYDPRRFYYEVSRKTANQGM